MSVHRPPYEVQKDGPECHAAVGRETVNDDATRDPFSNDVLQRLVASNQDYQRSHGHYIVPLSQRLLDTRAALDRLEAERAEAQEVADELNRVGLLCVDAEARAEAAEAEAAERTKDKLALALMVEAAEAERDKAIQAVAHLTDAAEHLVAGATAAEAKALVARSEIDWCIGYLGNTSSSLLHMLTSARSHLAEGDTP
jgi:hypothetical protein